MTELGNNNVFVFNKKFGQISEKWLNTTFSDFVQNRLKRSDIPCWFKRQKTCISISFLTSDVIWCPWTCSSWKDLPPLVAGSHNFIGCTWLVTFCFSAPTPSQDPNNFSIKSQNIFLWKFQKIPLKLLHVIYFCNNVPFIGFILLLDAL